MEKEHLMGSWTRQFMVVLCLVFLGGWQAMGQYSAPMEITNAKVYFEKFSPVTEFEVQQQVEKITLRKDSVEFLGALVELKEFYNKVIYRKLNEQIIREISSFDLSDRVIPVYRRDLNESNDTTIRYVIRNDLNMMEALISDYGRDNMRKLNFQVFYIEDLKTGEKYRSHVSIYNMLQVLNVHHSYTIGRKKRKTTPSEIENKISRSLAKLKVERTNQVDSSQLLMGVLGLLFLTIMTVAGNLN